MSTSEQEELNFPTVEADDGPVVNPYWAESEERGVRTRAVELAMQFVNSPRYKARADDNTVNGQDLIRIASGIANFIAGGTKS